MNNRGKLYIILTVLAILSIVVLEYTKPQKVNWFPSYASYHKIPFGTYVFQEQMERIFKKENIVEVDKTPFEFLEQKDSIQGTYVFINNNLAFGDAELDKLLAWTAKGNTLFIACEQLGGKLLDTLNIKTSVLSNFDNLKNSYQFQLKNKQLKKDSLYTFEKANYMYYYKEIDTLHTKVVSVIDNASNATLQLEEEHINTIKQSFGEGTIILSTFPQAFTNYFLLIAPNQNYTAGILSYINPSETIYIDQYYKSGKKYYSSPLYVMLHTKELKWAYYIMLIAVFIYVIFDGKRKQRAIPILKPLRNQTIDFTRTIANMYYEKEKHTEMANHKVSHFLEFIRSQFHLNTATIDATFLENLAARSNNTIAETTLLFKTIDTLQHKTEINKIELQKLNTLIEAFKSKNTWKKTKT
ncbi:DUF4350 domain-containing protein [Lacinutrix sp. WUR7]|uniref:DUF4350 domain-containing protein n=1 Tax=Lacinutrix sp. WUR7 TaxID=2653681 RepID=UPI00193EAE13|nr:DUF4350 domain-containing protein [Lacinutrix sp. WUR7]QRM87746.1 DUF4350 domain-containing protein [Lacinutrix sp. WUR7]